MAGKSDLTPQPLDVALVCMANRRERNSPVPEKLLGYATFPFVSTHPM
jgi:hypothetical protein